MPVVVVESKHDEAKTDGGPSAAGVGQLCGHGQG